MLTVSCKAAVKAVIYLGSRLKPDDYAGIKDIAHYINENEHTVGKVLQKLVRANLINSSKGPYGGFFISAKQKNQYIIEVVAAIDGLDIFKQCGLGFPSCNETRPCPFHEDFKKIREQFRGMCDENTIEDFCNDVEKGLAWVGR
ncbi:MAG: Rrf2 family transcriptional regulator [Bacteroidetes bacterium]|nr:Rrf2 family transcriptional regulator [Bacteroidota bacterium]